MEEMTEYLNSLRLRARDESPDAEELFNTVYEQLRRVARRVGGRSFALDPTELVHELYEQIGRRRTEWRDRGHFFRWAARVMEHVLIDHSRSRVSRTRREQRQLQVDRFLDHVEETAGPVADLVSAIELLEFEDARKAQIIRLHFWMGLSIEEVAAVVGVSRRTAFRELRLAKVRIKMRMS